MNRALALFFLAFWVSIPSNSRATDRKEDEKLSALFKSYFEEEFRLRPLEATRSGDHRFDHLLEDLSLAARQSWNKHTVETLVLLDKKIDFTRLSRPSQIDFEIFKHELRKRQWLAENMHPFEDDPRVYNDYLTDSIYMLLTQSSRPRAENIKNCVVRMGRLPSVIVAAKKNLKNSSRVFVETAIRQNRGALDFFQKGIFLLAQETPQLSDLAPPSRALVPLLEDYQKFLEAKLLTHATGQWRLGKEKFARKLELELDAGLTADQVLQEAQTEFQRVEREMFVIARQLWSRNFPREPLPVDDPEGRRSLVSRVLNRLNQNHGEADDLVRDVRATVVCIKKLISEKDILRLPHPDRCQIIEMPEFQRGNSVAYLSPAPPLDPEASSLYAISPPPRDWDTRRADTFLQEYNRSMLQILTIHEAYPGHYVQLEYSNRNSSLIRRVLSSGVFAEGWAVYCEQMMLDQGYGEGDLALRLNQLKWYLRAVANAILDYRMHCDGMTDDDAFRFLTQEAYQSEGEALGKIIRAKQSSCQLSTYFVGRNAFYRLRQQIQREQGDNFHLGRFHEAVLDHGTLPVKYLPELVRSRLKAPR